MRSRKEGWVKLKNAAAEKANAKIIQKTADQKVKNAEIAERIRGKLLRRLEREIDNLPPVDLGTERHQKEIKITETGKQEQLKVIKLRDLVASYKDLIDEDFKKEKLDLDKMRVESEVW